MSRAEVIPVVLLLGYAAAMFALVLFARRGFRRAYRELLEDEDVNHSMTTTFRRDDPAGPPPSPPALEDSSVWNMPKLPDPTVDEALPVILAKGTRAMACARCASTLTEHTMLDYTKIRGTTYGRIHEACNNCHFETVYFIDPMLWACIAAQRAWDEIAQADETITLVQANESLGPDVDLDQVRDDLRELDDDGA